MIINLRGIRYDFMFLCSLSTHRSYFIRTNVRGARVQPSIISIPSLAVRYFVFSSHDDCNVICFMQMNVTIIIIITCHAYRIGSRGSAIGIGYMIRVQRSPQKIIINFGTFQIRHEFIFFLFIFYEFTFVFIHPNVAIKTLFAFFSRSHLLWPNK